MTEQASQEPGRVRQATPADLAALVRLMTDFYAESGFHLDADRATQAFRRLLNDERLGRVWLLREGGRDTGYLVVTLGFSMEYGGHVAFVDDLYVVPDARGRGLGTAALEAARGFCTARGVRALHLEVGADNAPALRLYPKAGFRPSGRELLTLPLADPTHTTTGTATGRAIT